MFFLVDYQHLCLLCVFGLEKETGRREMWKGKVFLVCRVGIRMEFRTKLKILSISSEKTGVPGEITTG
jgi:hypothetical protein